MKIKRLLRFYFGAGSLDRALNNIIMRTAVAAGQDIYGGCELYAERMLAIISAKEQLSKLWFRLNGVICQMTVNDAATLKAYAAMRTGARGEQKREIHRAVVKFSRRAFNILSGDGAAYKILCAYYALVPAECEG